MKLPLAKSKYSLVIYFSIFLFGTFTTALFIYLNRVQPYYFIDEAFHIPQTLHYCDGNFTHWDPKITTLPGLYIVTVFALSPFNLCSTVYIRCMNLFGTFLNLYLLYGIISEKSKSEKTLKWDDLTKLAVTYNITLFPPLFFWHFLYYTDVMSVNMVLLMYLLHLRKNIKMAAVAGLFATFVRQTNIIWVAYLTIEHLFDFIEHVIQKPIPSKFYSSLTYLKFLWNHIMEQLHRGRSFFAKLVLSLCIYLFPYALVILTFIAFVVWNKGIVVGDRAAHVPTIHIPQLFYFSAFTSCFLWPYLITYWKAALTFIKNHLTLVSCFLAFIIIVIHFNTLVHPYVLADNRHYVFYVWNKLMGRYVFFRYLLTPVYFFTLYTMLCNIRHLRITTQINYVATVFIVLVPQLLIEPRYFIIPYIFYRLNMRKPGKWEILGESFITLLINFAQFFIFANKVFYWKDQEHPQRIAW